MPASTMRHPFQIAAFLFVTSVACSHADKDPHVQHPEALTAAGTVDVPPVVVPDVAETPPSAAFVAGPGGVPLPSDATQNTDMPSAGGKMFVYEIPRDRGAVDAELRSNLAADGWAIDSEEVSPGYGALRLQVSKDGNTVGVRMTGDDSRSGIIITVK